MPAPEMREGRWPVPALATHRELASWLGIDGAALAVLADLRSIARTAREQRHRHYRYSWIPKPRGGHRLVEAPKPRLRGVQRAILDGIVRVITPHEAVYGFRAGRSVVDAARLHVGRAVVLRVDLQSFFASVRAARVAGIFRTVGYPEGVAYTLAGLCTHRSPNDVLAQAPTDARDRLDLERLRTPHLPQGAPTSGALANLAAYRLDVRVSAYARRLGATYTRYADDIVLSSDDRAIAHSATTVVARLATIAADEGFSLNFRKTRVMTAADRQHVTGIVVNDKLAVPRKEVERLRAILHNCRRDGPATQNRDEHPDFRAYLRGRIAWIASLDASKGARLRGMLEDIDWT
jgi:retron-type reverse transcriptase